MQTAQTRNIGLVVAVGFGTLGCAGDDRTPTAVEHEPSRDPAGVYQDSLGSTHHVDASAWTVDSDRFDWVEFDAINDTATAKNAPSNRASAGKFSRFDWATDEDGQLRYCQTVLDAKTAAEASAAGRADESDWKKGCAGDAWSVLEGPAIAGKYGGQSTGMDEITGETWTVSGTGYFLKFELLRLSNSSRFVIAENDPQNGYNPGKFSRFDWTFDAAETLYYCQSTYDAETAEAALAAPPADSTDPATAGCGQSFWSQLVPMVP
jgi:hypothetical protein